MRNEYKELYKKYLQGTCTKDELQVLRRYFSELEHAGQLLDVEELLQKVDRRIVLSDEKTDAILQHIYAKDLVHKKVQRRKLYLKYAAAASLFLAAFLLLQHYLDNSAFSQRVYSNNGHTTQRIVLDDNSSVYLKPSSRLTQLSDFSKDKERIIHVDGEAFFAIQHNPDQPFVVRTDREFAVQVLGTRFNIIATDSQQEIVLTEGSVSLYSDTEQILLKPSERVFYSERAGRFETIKVDTLQYNAWIDNLLYFRDQELSNVIYEINKNYAYVNQKLSIPTQASNLQFTGYLPTDNLDKCITILNKTFANHQIIITKE